MTNLEALNSIASKITEETVQAQTTAEALNTIATKAKGETVTAATTAEALDVIDTYLDNITGDNVTLEANKTTTISSNGTIEIIPSENYDAMEKVTATVNIPDPTNKLRIDFFQVLPQGVNTISDITHSITVTKAQMNGHRLYIPGRSISYNTLVLGETITVNAIIAGAYNVAVECSLSGVAAAPVATLTFIFRFDNEEFDFASDTLLYIASGLGA